MSQPLLDLSSPSAARDRRFDLWARLALVALVLFVFGRIISYGYVEWDDQETIFANPALRPVTGHTFIDAWTRPYLNLYIPITHSLWAAMAACFSEPAQAGQAPVIAVMPFRILSLAMHIGSTLLVFGLVRRLGIRPWLAAFAATIFAIHPFQTEAVAWISGQKDLLATLLTLAAARAGMEAATRCRLDLVGVTWLLGTAAMLAKPQAVMAPVIVGAAAFAAGASWRRVGIVSIPLLLPAFVLALIAATVQPAPLVHPVPLIQRPLVVLDSIGFYASKFVFPVDLVVDYGRRPPVVLSGQTAVSAAVGLLLVAMVVGMAVYQRNRLALAGLVIAIAGVFPVLGFATFEYQYLSTVTDHYAYAAMFGIALTIAAVLRPLSDESVVWPGAGMAIVMALMSFTQAGYWHDTVRLFSHNLAVIPNSFAARRVLAFQRARVGDDAQAIELFEAALDTHPNDPVVLYNLANARLRRGELDLAHQRYQQAIAAASDNLPAHYNFAMLLIRQGDLVRAIAELHEVQMLNPDFEPARRVLERLHSSADATQPTTTSPTTRP